MDPKRNVLMIFKELIQLWENKNISSNLDIWVYFFNYELNYEIESKIYKKVLYCKILNAKRNKWTTKSMRPWNEVKWWT